MSLETKALYEFGRFRLDPAERLLCCDGKGVSLTPKVFDLLLALVEKKGRMVSKEELMLRLWPDSFVEEANLTVNISSLRKVLGEGSTGQEFIETVSKRGYRFIIPVTEVRNDEAPADAQVVSISVPVPEPVPAPKSIVQPVVLESPRRAVRWSSWFMGLALVVLAIGSGFFVFHSGQRLPEQQKPAHRSLAILPFRNLRQDPESEFLGFSLADAVINKLDYVSALSVRPSYAIEKYRNQVVDIQKVAAELNVDTLLTGTFMRDGDDLRISSQLIDVRTQQILWRNALDLKYTKLLSVQDEVAHQIIAGLALNLSASEAERMKPGQPIAPVAYEYYLRGVDLYARNDFPMAIKLLEKSAEMDPNYALTWAKLGTAYTADASFQFGGRELYSKAQEAYGKALSLQPSLIEARVYMANFYTDTGRVEEAVPLLREALKTNPNHAEVHWELGYAYRFAGMLPESVGECELARQLDPAVKLNSSAFNAYLYLGQYDRFLATLPDASDVPFNLFYRGFANYLKKNSQEATRDLDRAYQLDPTLFQAQVGKALSDSIGGRTESGLRILRAAQEKIERRGVGDSEAIYKMAQAYAVLGDTPSALRMLRLSIEDGFFPAPYIASDPLLDRVRSNAEFSDVLAGAQKRHVAFQKRFF